MGDLGLVLVALAAGLLAGLALGRRRGRTGDDCAARYRALAESFPSGATLLFDRRLRHTLVLGNGLDAAGLSRESLEGRTIRDALARETALILEPVYRAALEGDGSTLELPLGDRDYLVHVRPVTDPADGSPAGIVVLHDVTDHKRREHRLSELASRDPLTGLWNRRRLEHELERLLAEISAGRDPAASLLLVDLDGFKQVNDTLGHETGDELLRRVAQAIASVARRTDAVARLGGDEFAVLLPGARLEEAGQVAGKIAAAVEALWPLGTRGGASVGAARVGDGNWTVADVLAAADRAMYTVKRNARFRAAS